MSVYVCLKMSQYSFLVDLLISVCNFHVMGVFVQVKAL